MEKIRIAIVGLGNCASSLLQGIEYYRHKQPAEAIGLMHWTIGGYRPADIEVVAAFDIDKRKVGRDVNEAIFARPNCTMVLCPSMPKTGVSTTLTSGPAAMLQRVAPGRTGGATYATPPSGQSTIWFA